jgi:hypothetical protein
MVRHSSGSKRYGIRQERNKSLPWWVRIKASDWSPQEQVLGRFLTPEEAFECADRGLTNRWLRLGNNKTRVKLNEPDKLDKYIREEATKLLHREPERVYWFVTQASFKPLLDELELATTVVAVAVTVTVTGSLVAEDVEDFEDVEHLCKSCLTLSLSLSLSLSFSLSEHRCFGCCVGCAVCGHCQLFVSFVVCVCVCGHCQLFVSFVVCVCVCVWELSTFCQFCGLCVCVCVWASVLFFTVSLLSEPVPTAVPAAVPAAATPPVSVAELNIPEDDGLGNIIYVLFEFGCDAVFTYCFVFTCVCMLCCVVEMCVCVE